VYDYERKTPGALLAISLHDVELSLEYVHCVRLVRSVPLDMKNTVNAAVADVVRSALAAVDLLVTSEEPYGVSHQWRLASELQYKSFNTFQHGQYAAFVARVLSGMHKLGWKLWSSAHGDMVFAPIAMEGGQGAACSRPPLPGGHVDTHSVFVKSVAD
jgi:hypothetical protein